MKAREGADQAMRAMREGASDAGGKWDKLEQVFEQRVAKSLNRLGVITSKEVDDLSRQVRELNDNVRDMMRGGARSAKAAAPKRRASKAKRAKRKATATRKKAAKR